MEFLNPATGKWEKPKPPSLDDVLRAAQVVVARYDAGAFSDADYRVLRKVFGDALDKLHTAVGRFG